MMRVDKGPAEKTRMEFDHVSKMTPTSLRRLPAVRTPSTSPSSSEGEQTEGEDIDVNDDSVRATIVPEVENETKGSPVTEIGSNNNFAESPVVPDVKNKTNGGPDVAESGTNAAYDREAILHRLANLAMIEGEGQFVRDIIALKFGSAESASKMAMKYPEAPRHDKMSTEDRHKLFVDDLRETLKAVPDSLMHFIPGWFRPGDCGRPVDQKPDWFDVDKFRRGQTFARDNHFPIIYGQGLSQLAIFTIEDGLDVVIVSENSSTLYTATKRYMSTAWRIFTWCTSDPWTKGTLAWKNMMVVKAKHAAMTRKWATLTYEEIEKKSAIPNAWCPTREMVLKDISESCEAPAVGQCPFVAGRNNPNRPKCINQVQMTIVLWSVTGLITLFPKSFGLHHASDEDLEAYCFYWACIGYQLGIEDEYNICLGTFSEIRQRFRDFLESWIKPNSRESKPEVEHMGRCLMDGLNFVTPIGSYEKNLLYLLEMIGVQASRLRDSLSFTDRVYHQLWRYLFDYGFKIPGVISLCNAFLKRIFDRWVNNTPKDFEAVRIKCSKHPMSATGKKDNFVAVS